MAKTTPPKISDRSFFKRILYRMTQAGIWCVARPWFRLQVEGEPKFPREGPVLVLSNHQSHLDPPLLGAAAKRPMFYLARHTLFDGFSGFLMRTYNAIPIDRDGPSLSGLRAVLGHLKKGHAVLLFPEGTRSPDGELQPIKAGFVTLARRGKATIVPVALAGAHEALPRSEKWPRAARVAVCFGDPIGPQQIATLDDEAVTQLVADRLAACLARGHVLRGATPSLADNAPTTGAPAPAAADASAASPTPSEPSGQRTTPHA